MLILDKTCLVWGKTCTGTGNCWLYDVESLRYIMNLTAAAFVTIGTLFDVGVWYSVKDLKIYDDDDEIENNKNQQMKVLQNGKQDNLQVKANNLVKDVNKEETEHLMNKQNGHNEDVMKNNKDVSTNPQANNS